MLAEQQKAQQVQHQQQLQRQQQLQHPSNVFPATPQQQQHFSGQLPFVSNASILNNSSTHQFAGNVSENMLRIVNNTNTNVTRDFAGIMPSGTNGGSTSSAMSNNVTADTFNVRTEIPSSEVLSMFNLSTGDGYSTNSNTDVNSYKPSNTHLGTFKKSASTGAYINVCANNSGLQQMYFQQDGGIQVEQTGQMSTAPQSLPSQIGSHLAGLASAIQPRPLSHVTPTSISSSQRTLSLKLNMSSQSSQINNTPVVPVQQTHLQTQQVGQAIMSNTMPKEMYRSNSLPLNSSMQKLEARQTSNEHFVVPKYQAAPKSVKSRMRSNSIHHHLSQTPSNTNLSAADSMNGDTGNLNVNTQLHTASSDPMLNSTLAQLLTASKIRKIWHFADFAPFIIRFS